MSYATAKRSYLHSRKLRRKRDEYEELYMYFEKDMSVEPTELGSEQFYRYESFGEKPEVPDPYYLRLCQGKKWFSVQQESIQESYLTMFWWGWYCYWMDWKGNRWMLQHLMSWHPEPPEWLFKEDEEMSQQALNQLHGIDEIRYIEPMSFYPEPTPEEVNGPPKCEWCQDRKIIYGETPGRMQGETCPMCK